MAFRPSDPVVSITGTILRESERAIQLTISRISDIPVIQAKTEWFPLSQISRILRHTQAGKDVLMISEWLYKQKQLENLLPEQESPEYPDDIEFPDDYQELDPPF